MSIDLTAAIEAAARFEYERCWRYLDDALTPEESVEATTWDATPSEANKEEWRAQVRLYLEAAAPLIEAAVREAVAVEIEVEIDSADGPRARTALRNAARIARGQS